MFGYEKTTYLEIIKPYANGNAEFDNKKTNFNVAFGITKGDWTSD